MTDANTPTPPPLPDRPAAEAARAGAAPVGTAGAEGIAGVDDTGVPRLTGDLDDIGRGFLAALFDLTFTRFITRRLASVFYLVGLVAIGISFVAAFVGGIVSGIGALWWNPGGGIALIVLLVQPLLIIFAGLVFAALLDGGVRLLGRVLPIGGLKEMS